jgi:hypothetical protein
VEWEEILEIAFVSAGYWTGQGRERGDDERAQHTRRTARGAPQFPRRASTGPESKLQRLAESLRIEAPVVVRGELRVEEGAAPMLAVSSIEALEDIVIAMPRSVQIHIQLERASESTLIDLQRLIADSPGRGQLMMHLEHSGAYCVVMEPMEMTIGADRAFLDRAESLLGRGMVRIVDQDAPNSFRD